MNRPYINSGQGTYVHSICYPNNYESDFFFSKKMASNLFKKKSDAISPLT